MVRIRLRRMGIKHKPAYRVVVADSRAPRDGKFIETIGHYNPQLQPKIIVIKEDRARYWLGVGAQPSDTVARLLRGMGVLDAEGKIIAPSGEQAEAPAPERKPARRKKPAAPAAQSKAAVAETKPVAAPVVEATPVVVPAVAAADTSGVVATSAPATANVSAGAHKGSVRTHQVQAEAPEGYTIKGNESSMLYHVPGSRYYNTTVAETWFDTVEHAEAAGFRAPGSHNDDEAPAAETRELVVEDAQPAVVMASAPAETSGVVATSAPVAETLEPGSYPGSVKTLASGATPEGYAIKGNESSMLYHVPGSRYYNSTDAEFWFDTVENAEAAGFRAPGQKAKPKHEAGPYTGSLKAVEGDDAPEGYAIKGNESSKLYHVPGSRYYNATEAEYWFDTAENAEAAGFRAPGSQKS